MFLIWWPVESCITCVQTGVLNRRDPSYRGGGSDETATIRQRKEIKTLLYYGSIKPPTFVNIYVTFQSISQLMHFHIQDITREPDP